MVLKPVLDFLIGVFICAIIALLGVLFTKIITHGFGFLLRLPLAPISANYFYKKNKKQIAYGIISGLIPIGILVFIIISFSKLH